MLQQFLSEFIRQLFFPVSYLVIPPVISCGMSFVISSEASPELSSGVSQFFLNYRLFVKERFSNFSDNLFLEILQQVLRKFFGEFL